MENPNIEVIDERRGATSASNAEADTLCPGRHLAQIGMPAERGEYAELGTKLHAALALADPSELDLLETETYDRCHQVRQAKLAEFFGVHAPAAKRWAENPKDPLASRLWVRVPSSNGFLEHSCRPDEFWRLKDRALIFEWKSLYGDVPVSARNLQLRDQQVLIRGNFMIPGDIGVCVVQPKITMNPEICVYTPEDSERARQEMFARVLASNDPRSVRVPGTVQCQWCRAKLKCLEYQRYAAAMLPGLLDVLDVPVGSWSPQQRAVFLDRYKIADAWLQGTRNSIYMGLKADPAYAPGWFITPPVRVETIADAQACFERCAAKGMTAAQFMECVKVGKEKLRTILSGVIGERGKALDTTLAEICRGIVEVSQRAGALKPTRKETSETKGQS